MKVRPIDPVVIASWVIGAPPPATPGPVRMPTAAGLAPVKETAESLTVTFRWPPEPDQFARKGG